MLKCINIRDEVRRMPNMPTKYKQNVQGPHTFAYTTYTRKQLLRSNFFLLRSVLVSSVRCVVLPGKMERRIVKNGEIDEYQMHTHANSKRNNNKNNNNEKNVCISKMRIAKQAGVAAAALKRSFIVIFLRACLQNAKLFPFRLLFLSFLWYRLYTQT